jgi:hypothetical protein
MRRRQFICLLAMPAIVSFSSLMPVHGIVMAIPRIPLDDDLPDERDLLMASPPTFFDPVYFPAPNTD